MDQCWNLNYDEYEAEKEGLREALCTLGNGYFATRAAHEESRDDNYHYPGTYLAGGYNRLESEIAGQVIENEDLVNWPNWLVLRFKPADGEWLNLDEMSVLAHRQTLNLREGLLQRFIHVKDGDGRETIIESSRLVHMQHPHLAAIQWKLTPKNWSGKIIIHSALDGSVINNGVARYRDLRGRHLQTLDHGTFEEDGIFIKTKATQSEVVMAQAAKVSAYFDRELPAVSRHEVKEEDYIAHQLTFEAEENRTVRIEKIVAIYTSRDAAVSDPLNEAQNAIMRAESFEALRANQATAWRSIWDRVDTQFEGDHPEDQLVLRLHIFHILQTVSLNSIGLDVGVPSRGWHGEAYRGHIFWDELFICPFLSWTVPEITRSLLIYRYRRLPEARYNARSAGYRGAMFPWQSGSNGREESQKIHLNPKSGNWIPDDSRLQRHVNAAIAYNVWQYYQITRDHEFLHFFGAELILDIACFWSGKVTWNERQQKFEILKVVGPDEYHTHYPGSKEPGLNNNAYTNVMVIWVMKHALEVLKILDEKRQEELKELLKITREELNRWEEITRKMFIPFVKPDRIFSQFEGFEDLEELDWDYYHKEYGEVLRLDRIMEKEGKDVNKYKASKQADVLMLFYLFSAEELTELVTGCGYNFKPTAIPENIKYYQERTAHGSTLSKVVHSWVLARSDRSHSWHNFKDALMSDFADVQGGTTPEGIHLGAMAGTVDLIQRGYLGLEMREDKLWFNPQLPESLKCISCTMRYCGIWIKIKVKDGVLSLTRKRSWHNGELNIVVKGQEYVLKRGETKQFRLLKSTSKLIEA